MSDLELQKIEELIARAISSPKKSFLSPENLIKIGLYVVLAVLAFAGISSKIDTASKDIMDIKVTQKNQIDKWDVDKESIRLDISACKLNIGIMQEQLKQLKENQKK